MEKGNLDTGKGGAHALVDPDIVSKVNEFGVKYTLVATEDKRNNISARIVRIHVSNNRLHPSNEGIKVQAGDDVIVEDPITVGKVRFHANSSKLIAAHDNGTIAVAETYENGAHYLRYAIERPENDQKWAKLPEAPHCLHVYGTAVYIGLSRSVAWVDFSSPEPKCIQLCERNMQHKAYDLFTRKGNHLIAVDDKMYPFYADSFRLVGDAANTPMHEEGWILPSLVNGRYNMAVATSHELLLGYGYYNRTGEGQTLIRMPLSEMKENGSKHPKTRLTETRRGQTIIASRTDGLFTYWEGMAVNEKSILLAAGERGLLEVPMEFVDSTKAKVTKFGLPVHSAYVKEGATWVSVGRADVGTSGFALVKVGGEEGRVLEHKSLPGEFKLLC